MANKLFTTTDRNEAHEWLATYLAANPESRACCRDEHPNYEVWDDTYAAYVAPPPPPAAPSGGVKITLSDDEVQRIADLVVQQLREGA